MKRVRTFVVMAALIAVSGLEMGPSGATPSLTQAPPAVNLPATVDESAG